MSDEAIYLVIGDMIGSAYFSLAIGCDDSYGVAQRICVLLGVDPHAPVSEVGQYE